MNNEMDKFKDLGFTLKTETVDGKSLTLFKFNDDCDLNNPEIRKYKGMIVDTETGKPVVQNYSTPIDYLLENPESFSEKFKDCKVYELIDGTMFRIYFFNGLWRISTNGMITPKKGWSSPKNFLELFNEGLRKTPINFDQLNQKYVYLVVLKHPENTIVVRYPRPGLVHVGTMDMTSGEGVEVETDIGVPKPEEYQVSLTELVEKLGQEQSPVKFAGLMIRDKDNERYRVESSDYITARALRSNYPSKLAALMEVRDDPEKVVQFEKYFGLNLEKSLERISKNILTHYTRYRKLRIPDYYSQIPPNYLPVIHQVHGIYIRNKENGINRPVCLEDVRNIINNLEISAMSRVFDV
jgi:hypothetical protein